MAKSDDLRDGVIMAGALVLGWWAHGGNRPVAAASSHPDLVYQFSDSGPGASLTMYNPTEQMLYVYQAAALGQLARQLLLSLPYRAARRADGTRELCHRTAVRALRMGLPRPLW